MPSRSKEIKDNNNILLSAKLNKWQWMLAKRGVNSFKHKSIHNRSKSIKCSLSQGFFSHFVILPLQLSQLKLSQFSFLISSFFLYFALLFQSFPFASIVCKKTNSTRHLKASFTWREAHSTTALAVSLASCWFPSFCNYFPLVTCCVSSLRRVISLNEFANRCYVSHLVKPIEKSNLISLSSCCVVMEAVLFPIEQAMCESKYYYLSFKAFVLFALITFNYFHTKLHLIF